MTYRYTYARISHEYWRNNEYSNSRMNDTMLIVRILQTATNESSSNWLSRSLYKLVNSWKISFCILPNFQLNFNINAEKRSRTLLIGSVRSAFATMIDWDKN